MKHHPKCLATEAGHVLCRCKELWTLDALDAKAELVTLRGILADALEQRTGVASEWLAQLSGRRAELMHHIADRFESTNVEGVTCSRYAAHDVSCGRWELMRILGGPAEVERQYLVAWDEAIEEHVERFGSLTRTAPVVGVPTWSGYVAAIDLGHTTSTAVVMMQTSRGPVPVEDPLDALVLADHFRPDWVRANRRGTLSAALHARLDQEMQARFDVRVDDVVQSPPEVPK